MIFKELILQGAYLIETNPFRDERGAFSRTFCRREFENLGLNGNMVQSNMSDSLQRHTLRGMHYQINEYAEDKLISCMRGAILDVIIDIRSDSPSYLKYHMQNLSENDGLLLYVPRGFAHGFLTLSDHCRVFYQVSNFYNKDNERGIRWNDPAFTIPWPVSNPTVSSKDRSHPYFRK